jgi:hypothetical protein
MSKRNNTRRRIATSLPTPIHSRFSTTFSYATSSGLFTRGLQLISIPQEEVNSSNFPRSMLVGNVDLSCSVDVDSSFAGVANHVEVAIMKVPRDVRFDDDILPDDLIRNHPEWIFCYKYIGRPSDATLGQQYQPTRVVSRKKKRLFSGDKLWLVVTANKTGVALSLKVAGVFTCNSRLD